MRIDPMIVRQRFSRAAKDYDVLSSIQREVARGVFNQLNVSSGARVLDVGAGTGSLLCEASHSAEKVEAVGLDIAEGMVQRARREHPELIWVCADAVNLPFQAWSFDMVFSSSSYQWVSNLPLAFSEVKRVLKKDGRFYAALFGRSTLAEFFESLEAALLMNGRSEVFPFRRLPSEEEVRLALKKAYFQHGGVMMEKRTLVFKDVWELLKWTKAIGANSLTRGFFLSKGLLADLERHYAARYTLESGLTATFEIIWVDARK